MQVGIEVILVRPGQGYAVFQLTIDRLVVLAVNVWVYLAYARVVATYIRQTRRLPNPADPASLNDKFFWRKVFDRNPEFAALSDKLESKRIAREKCPDISLPRTIWTGQRPEDIPDAVLAGNVVVKATHGSGYFKLVRNGDYDRAELEAEANRWMQARYGRRHWEWGYFAVKPRLYVEELILDSDGGYDTTEAKMYYYCGVICRTVMLYNRQTDHPSSDAFRQDWSLFTHPSSLGLPRDMRPAPENVDQIEMLARQLCAGLDHVRCDLYLVGNKTYFGEFTLYNQGGYSVGGTGDPRKRPDFVYWDLRQSWFMRTPQRGLPGVYARCLRRMIERRDAADTQACLP